MSQNALIVFQCYLIQQFEVSCAGNHVWLTRHDASPPVVDDIPYQHTSQIATVNTGEQYGGYIGHISGKSAKENTWAQLIKIFLAY